MKIPKDIFNTKKIAELDKLSSELQEKTTSLSQQNQKLNSFIANYYGFEYESYTGENSHNELGVPKELIIEYDYLRTRSWYFLFKNHIASLIVNKRVNWQIGSGLLYNAQPYEKPFTDYYGEKEGKEKRLQFIRDVEYLARNYISSKEIDYKRKNNLHEMAREADYNASGDGDVFFIMRVKNGFPNIQLISGQCVVNPSISEYTIPEGHTINEGVETNKKGEVVAYHVLSNINTSNTAQSTSTDDIVDSIGTVRVPAYFKGVKIRRAWLYRASDLQQISETRALPLLSKQFETLQHINDYLIANSKHAQLSAQMVIALKKDNNSDGARVFQDNTIAVGGVSQMQNSTETIIDETRVKECVNVAEGKLNKNGIVLDMPKGVETNILNPTAQSDQGEYLKSSLQTLFAEGNTPYEVMLSSYGSNYTASMGARGDYQYLLDIMVELIPGNQLYKMYVDMLIYTSILNGKLDCPPLKKAYQENDIVTTQAIIKSKFEGTKLKPIDPLKFIKSLREQLPESIRQLLPLNTLENIVNASSGMDYESVLNQSENEMLLIPDELKPVEEPPNNIPKSDTLKELEDFYNDNYSEKDLDISEVLEDFKQNKLSK
jgi:capsid protein